MPIKGALALLAAGVLLVACGGERPVVPVTDRTSASRSPESATRTVVHGDTLYSIAWESGRDYHDLAAWNSLAPPYTIVPGQQLRLYPPPVAAAVKKPPAPKVRPRRTRSSARPPAPVIRNAKPAAPVAGAKPKKPAPRAPSAAMRPAAGGGIGWTWPADGRILKNFDENGAGKGLDIGGSRGQPVQAAAAGRVVYQGSGLRGYGQLIIIKHNDEFLSAYAHNDRIYIKEGDTVNRGQKIAAMGNSGTDHVMLHFEIRRNGKPVDPLKFLPKR